MLLAAVFVRVEAHAAGGVSLTDLQSVLILGTSNASALCSSSLEPASSTSASTSTSTSYSNRVNIDTSSSSARRTSSTPDVLSVTSWWFILVLVAVVVLVVLLLCIVVWLLHRRLRSRRHQLEVTDCDWAITTRVLEHTIDCFMRYCTVYYMPVVGTYALYGRPLGPHIRERDQSDERVVERRGECVRLVDAPLQVAVGELVDCEFAAPAAPPSALERMASSSSRHSSDDPEAADRVAARHSHTASANLLSL